MIKLENISKTYKSWARKVRALQDVTVTLPEKGMVFLTGESGAGKSTFLRVLTLQESPTRGQIFLDGLLASSLSDSERSNYRASYFGIVFQEGNLVEDMTIFDNLKLARSIEGKELTEKEASEVMEKVSLNRNLLYEFPKNLSGGQSQRVAIARCLLKDSKVIIADEPTASLDQKNAEITMDLFKEQAKDKLILVVSHDEKIANKYQDGFIHLEKGRVTSSNLGSLDQEEGKTLAPTPTKMPLKDLFGLSLKTFKRTMGKSSLCLASLAIAFTAVSFGVAYPITSDVDHLSYRIKETGTKHGYVAKYQSETVLGGMPKKKPVEILAAERNIFESVYGNVAFPVPSYFAFDDPAHDPTSEELPRSFCPTEIMISSEKFFRDFDLPYLGKLPTSNEGTHEIMITRAQAVALNFIKPEQMNDEKTLMDIISTRSLHVLHEDGKEENRKRVPFFISGIIDTGYQYIKEWHQWFSIAEQSVLDSRLRNHLDQLLMAEFHNTMFLSPADAAYFRASHINPHYCHIPVTHGEIYCTEKLQKALSVHNFKGTPEVWCRVSKPDDTPDSKEDPIRYIMAIVSLLFAPIALLLLFYFVTGSIKARKNEIKAMRALGIHSADLFWIFNSQACLASGISVLLASLFYGFYVFFRNAQLQAFYVFFNPFVFHAWLPFAALAVAFAVCSIVVSIAFFGRRKSEK